MQVNATTPLPCVEVSAQQSALIQPQRTPRGRPRVTRDLAVMLAGGDRLTDLGALRREGVLFGEVSSDATVYLCLERLDKRMLSHIRHAVRAASAA